MYGGPLQNMQHLYLYGRVTLWGSVIWKYKGRWGVWYDRMWMDKVVTRKIIVVGEDNSNMW
jgi:hypothetical protein